METAIIFVSHESRPRFSGVEGKSRLEEAIVVGEVSCSASEFCTEPEYAYKGNRMKVLLIRNLGILLIQLVGSFVFIKKDHPPLLDGG